MDLTSLHFEGYHYDSETASKCGSVFYIKDDNEDDWLEIIPLYNTRFLYTILTIESCETVKAEIWSYDDGEFIRCE